MHVQFMLVQTVVKCFLSLMSVFTADLFVSVKMNPGRFAWLVRFVYAGVKAVNQPLIVNCSGTDLIIDLYKPCMYLGIIW